MTEDFNVEDEFPNYPPPPEPRRDNWDDVTVGCYIRGNGRHGWVTAVTGERGHREYTVHGFTEPIIESGDIRIEWRDITDLARTAGGLDTDLHTILTVNYHHYAQHEPRIDLYVGGRFVSFRWFIDADGGRHLSVHTSEAIVTFPLLYSPETGALDPIPEGAAYTDTAAGTAFIQSDTKWRTPQTGGTTAIAAHLAAWLTANPDIITDPQRTA